MEINGIYMVSIGNRLFIIITEFQVSAIDNNMNLEEKKNLVIQLHQEGKTQREIAQAAHMSIRDISKIIRKIFTWKRVYRRSSG